jgi:hypothetical protein
VLFGYGGLRIEKHLVFNPLLISNTTFMRFKGIHYQSLIFDIEYDINRVTITLTQGNSVQLSYSGLTKKLLLNQRYSFTRTKFFVSK